MGTNRRSSLPIRPPTSDEEQPNSAQSRSQTRLRSRSVSEPLVQASSVCENEERTWPPQVADVTVGPGFPDSTYSTPSYSRSYCSTGDLSSGHENSKDPPFPLILVGAPKETETPEQAKMDQGTSTPIEPISEVPFVEPTLAKRLTLGKKSISAPEEESSISSSDVPSSFHKSTISTVPALKFSSLNEIQSYLSVRESKLIQSYTETSELYDKEEPLITKTQKFYKKRAPLVPRYDSDDSYAINKEVLQQDNRSMNSVAFNMTAESDSPGSFSDFDAERRKDSDLWAETTTSMESIDLARGRRLGSGMVFIYMVIPPDGGYGWLIMVFSFLAQLIIDGLIFTIGNLLPFIAEDLGEPMTSVLFVASVQIGCYFLSGMFAAGLINRFGFRAVAIAGVLASAVAIVIASFSVSLIMLICFYSVIGGVTLSMIWASSQLIVGYYFERYRPMANGFSCSGGGAGIVLFTFLNSWLVPIIGWRNMLRTQAGFVLLIALLALGFVEVAPTQVGLYHHAEAVESSSDEYYGNFYVHDYIRLSNQTNTNQSAISTYEPSQKKSRCGNLCSCCRSRCGKKKTETKHEEEQNLLIRPAPMEREDLFYTGPAEYDRPRSKERLEGKEFHLMGTDKNTQQVNYGIERIHADDEDATRSKNQRWKAPPKKPVPKWRQSRFVTTLVKLFDYHLLKNFEFQILVTSAFLYPMGFNIPFIYSGARAEIPKKYARMIGPVIGITNLLFRNLLGFLAFKRRTWPSGLYGYGLIFGGGAVFVSAFFGQDLIWFQMFYGASFAVASAVYSTMRGLIYVKYLGLSKLTNAFGISSLAMGMGVFLGTSIAGELVGSTRNYTPAFGFAGVCLMSSGLLVLLLPAFIKLRNRRAH
ncbi:LOW QUALITY PROTEIN: uncharacterized protein LOC108086692 [Drosophila ficusphila]|uniref:LOW QUALITY PROTEIN: uncharacterized protein LOC108086692 n=1 Tax=Drosophila ficusphila TaxID=30025 RepID=UPI0007E8ADA0|nr:LOW QUALITY PROTEIN: uncharacterized protein LOC108086692 [Drosophila ficusphila]